MALRFLADEMLKKLAKWLRVFGVNIEYDFVVGKTDREIIEYARKKRLIFLTKDMRLEPSLRKRKIRHFLVHFNDIDDQIADVLSAFGIKPDLNKTRCPFCNGILYITKKARESEAPAGVRKKRRKFWRCRKCKKVYWKGGHWKNIERRIRKVRTRLATNSLKPSEPKVPHERKEQGAKQGHHS
ncbi:MAG: Mut7-C RNAse domain-containing protein [Candidatus Anstonellales archaeon]